MLISVNQIEFDMTVKYSQIWKYDAAKNIYILNVGRHIRTKSVGICQHQWPRQELSVSAFLLLSTI